MSGPSKGSAFERELCKKLSLWWTFDLAAPDDSVFWRTAGSGGRATIRGRKNKKTANAYGDICCLDPIGQDFLRAFCTEIKRGYSKFTIADLLDKRETSAKQKYEEWIEQAIHSHLLAGSYSWLLIVRRDQRLPLVFLPKFVIEDLLNLGVDISRPYLELSIKLSDTLIEISGMTLENFLKDVKPEHIKKLLDR